MIRDQSTYDSFLQARPVIIREPVARLSVPPTPTSGGGASASSSGRRTGPLKGWAPDVKEVAELTLPMVQRWVCACLMDCCMKMLCRG